MQFTTLTSDNYGRGLLDDFRKPYIGFLINVHLAGSAILVTENARRT
jgi:hypothetical protein